MLSKKPWDACCFLDVLVKILVRTLHDNRYESEIFDAGVEGKAPMTRVTALGEDPPYSYVGPTPTHAWQQAIEAVNNVCQTRRRCAVRALTPLTPP